MSLAFRLWFHRIDVHGKPQIPKGGPLILVVNHPNSFLDAFLAAWFIQRKVRFTVRGDLFNAPVTRFILESLYQLPLYRGGDGRAQLERNSHTFERCQEILAKNGVVLVFGEGYSIAEKRLRKLRKGAARIAINTLIEQGAPEVTLLPVAVNYSNLFRPGTKAMMSYGPPVKASDYLSEYTEKPAVALRNLTQRLEDHLKASVIHIPDPEHDDYTDLALEIYRSTQKPSSSWITESRTALDQERQLALQLSDLFQHQLDAPLVQNLSAYQLRLDQLGLVDEVIAANDHFNTVLAYLYQGNRWLLDPARIIAERIVRSYVHLPEFKSSIWLSISWFLNLLFGAVLLSIGFLSGNWMVMLGIPIVLALMYLLRLYGQPETRKLKFYQIQRGFRHYKPASLRELLDLRQEIEVRLQELQHSSKQK